MYFSGQGKVIVALVSNGIPGPFREIGNNPSIEAQFQADELKHKESGSGQRLIDKKLTREKSVNLTIQMEDFSAKNLALATRGLETTVAGATVQNEVMPTGLVAGDIVRLDNPKISAVTITDSAGVPATLVAGTDYEIHDANHGTIKILDVTGLTQPFHVDYTYAGFTNVRLMSEPAPELWFRFHGINTAESNAPMLVEFYRVQLSPLDRLPLINDDLASFTLNGEALIDVTKVNDAQLGQLGRVVL